MRAPRIPIVIDNMVITNAPKSLKLNAIVLNPIRLVSPAKKYKPNKITNGNFAHLGMDFLKNDHINKIKNGDETAFMNDKLFDKKGVFGQKKRKPKPNNDACTSAIKNMNPTYQK